MIRTAHAVLLDMPNAVARAVESIFLSGNPRIAENRRVVSRVDSIQTARDHKAATPVRGVVVVVAVVSPSRRSATQDIESRGGRDQGKSASSHGDLLL